MSPFADWNYDYVLGAPTGWDARRHGPCDGLPITRHDGVQYSYWRPSWREWLGLLLGARIQLAVVGESHPVVAMDIAHRSNLPTRGQ